MSLINGYEVEKNGFRREENGVFLDDKTFKIFLKKYETKLRTSTGYLNYGDEKVSFRKALWIQASKLAKAIDEEDYTLYEPIYIRQIFIQDNKRRRNFVKFASRYALRVQRSVFEGKLSKNKYEDLISKVVYHIADEDNVRVYRISGNGEVKTWGNVDIPEVEEVIII